VSTDYPIAGGFPNWRAPLTNPNGTLTQAGLYLLQLLWNRTGNSSGQFLDGLEVVESSTPIFFGGDESEEATVIPGPVGPSGAQGIQGIQGASGPALVIDVPEPDEPPLRSGLLFPGGWFDEKGSGGTYGFAAGVDFTGGSSTTLTLSQGYGSQANLIVTFDAGFQGADTFSLNGTTLTFTSAIPSGVQKVYVKGFLMPR
jgi:hypothetical protein